MNDFFETDDILKSYDSSIVRRILKYLKPYKLLLFIASITLVIATAAELVTPILLQKVIDKALLNTWVAIDTKASGDFRLRNIDIPKDVLTVNGKMYVNNSLLKTMSSENKQSLENDGLLDNKTYYLTKAPDVLSTRIISDINNKKDVIVANGWFIATTNYVNSLDAVDAKIIRKADKVFIVTTGWIFFALSIITLAATFFQVFTTSLIGQHVMRDLRMDLFKHTTRQSLSFLSKQPVGRLVTRLTSDVETINEFFTSVLVAFIKDASIMLGAIIVLYVLSPRLAFIVTLTLPPVLIATSISRHKARDAFRKQRLWLSKVNSFIAEHVAGIAVVKLFTREKAVTNEFEKKDEALMKANLGEMYVFAVFRPLIELFSSISVAIILWFGAGFYKNGLITLGALLAFVNLVRMFYSPIQDMSEKYTLLQSAMAGGERVFKLLDTSEKIKDEPKQNLPLTIRGCIEFDHVWFAYNDNDWVIKDLSFTVEPGQMLAIVGYTGSGKSTIAALLTRMWDPQKGQIRLDGIPITDIPLKELRSTIRPVMQDVFLFSGTVASNISLGLNIDADKIEKSAKLVRAGDFIEKLDGKYEAILGEGAASLSSGQRQLLSFARVVAHDPSIIVLDEATSSVDTETESLLQKGLDALMEGRTTIAIAHRLSTIKHANIIIVISEGSLAEVGTHDSLIANHGLYYNLYRLQYNMEMEKNNE